MTTQDTLRIALIGAGNMGEAIIGGLLAQQVVPADRIVAAEPRTEQQAYLRDAYHIDVQDDAKQVAALGNVVIFAVKPQLLPRLLPTMRGVLSANALAISIAAGTPIRVFAELLGHTAIVRAMPNTPSQIGAGMTVWTATADVSEQQRRWTHAILGALGKERYLEHEQFIDMATALNGSGPAYFFLMFEAMIDAGVHMGLSRDVATELVLHTALGSARYAIESGMHLAQLRHSVTSPGGTTIAALNALQRGNLPITVSDAIWAAYHRACELGEK